MLPYYRDILQDYSSLQDASKLYNLIGSGHRVRLRIEFFVYYPQIRLYNIK